MKAAVTGGTGFLGRQLVSRLLENGMDVRCLVRPTSDLGALGGEREALSSGRLELSVANFHSADALAPLLADCEVVYHLASTLTGSTAVMFASNVVVTRRLIQAAHRANLTRLVHVSSLGVYDTRHLGRNGILNEDCPVDQEPHRRDPYTYSKVAQENVIRELTADRYLPLVIIRPGVIYGPGRDCLSNRVGLRFGNLLIQVCGRRCVPYTHARNCAEAIFLAGIIPGIDGEVFNVIDDDLPTASALVRALSTGTVGHSYSASAPAGSLLVVIGLPVLPWLVRRPTAGRSHSLQEPRNGAPCDIQTRKPRLDWAGSRGLAFRRGSARHSRGFARIASDRTIRQQNEESAVTIEQVARPLLHARVLRFARKIRGRLSERRSPRVTKYMGQDSDVIQCCVAYNRHGGYCIPLDCRHRPAVQAILAGNVWEPRTIDLLASHAAGGDLVHAGTFFGDFLPALARLRGPGAKVWAFEPNPENYRCALITAQINQLRNVELLNAGLGECRGSLPMVTTDHRGRPLGGASQIVSDADQSAITVDVVTVDESIPPDRQVSLIQLDVENFEKQALAGALRTIRRCRPILVLENLPAEVWLTEHLFPLGYRLSGQVHDNSILRSD